MDKRKNFKTKKKSKKCDIKHPRKDILTPIGKQLWDDTENDVTDMDEILNCPIIPGKIGVES